MLINLVPDFFAVLSSTDRVAAYQQYFQSHRARLAADAYMERLDTTQKDRPSLPSVLPTAEIVQLLQRLREYGSRHSAAQKSLDEHIAATGIAAAA